MKKNIKVKIASLAVILLTLFAGSLKMNAQCGPYIVKNLTTCYVIVNINYACVSGPSCAGSGPAGIPPGGNITIPVCYCTSGGGLCNISVQLQQIGGYNFTTPPSVSPGTNATYNSSICPSAGTMNFSGATVYIN